MYIRGMAATAEAVTAPLLPEVLKCVALTDVSRAQWVPLNYFQRTKMRTHPFDTHFMLSTVLGLRFNEGPGPPLLVLPVRGPDL